MDRKLQKIARLCNGTHILTVIVLAAIAMVCLIPLAARPTAMHRDAPRVIAGSKTTRSTPSTLPAAAATTTTVVPPITTTTQLTLPTPPVTTPPAPAPHAPAVEASQIVPSGYGCAPALAYLQAHAAPGFTFECPGWADGHQAMTCINVAGVCSGTKVIAISIPCPAAYMNEASNSWVVMGESDAPLDPYGFCH
jgi:hypothetical protein